MESIILPLLCGQKKGKLEVFKQFSYEDYRDRMS